MIKKGIDAVGEDGTAVLWYSRTWGLVLQILELKGSLPQNWVAKEPNYSTISLQGWNLRVESVTERGFFVRGVMKCTLDDHGRGWFWKNLFWIVPRSFTVRGWSKSYFESRALDLYSEKLFVFTSQRENRRQSNDFNSSLDWVNWRETARKRYM